jgi:hypothetical protein
MEVFWFSMFWAWILELLQVSQSFGLDVVYHSRYFYVMCYECGDNNDYMCQHRNARHIFTNLWRCCLQLELLENLIFVSKNGPSDPRDGCKLPSNFAELIQIDLGFEEELEEFEGSFEQDEIVNM